MRYRLVVAFAVAACRSPAPAPAEAKGSTEVAVDRRIELISIVERLAAVPPYTLAHDVRYVTEVDRTFAAFAQDPAVVATRALASEHGISYDAPMDLAVHLDEHLAPRGAPNDPRWQGVDVAAYAAELRGFAERSHFEAFFAAHRVYFDEVEARVREAIARENPASWLDAFFGGHARARYVVVPGMLEGPHNFGVRFTATDATEMYQVLGLGEPDAKGLPVLDDRELELLVHEMAHSYINPLVAQHLGELAAPAEAMFAQVAIQMAAQAYGSAEVVLDESLVRAIVVLYLRDRHGEARAKAAIGEQERLGFVWTGAIVDELAHYQAQRASTPDFAAFVPALAKRLGELAATGKAPHTGFAGPINGVLVPGVAFVVPADTPAVAQYATKIHDALFVASALGTELPARGNAIVYGAAASATVAPLLAAMGAQVRADGITLGTKQLAGTHLALIACWPRTDDPDAGLVIYTAADPADLPGINSLRHGTTDWVIARRDGTTFATVASGTFEHAPWHAP
jgi:hypothetical protein